MQFIDEATIEVQAGDGGDGCIAFRREKYRPKGGPSGGDGGDGGHIELVADAGKSTLADFRYRARYKAERGQHGMGSDCNGRAGASLEVPVPVGTLVRDLETGEVLVDLKSAGQRFRVAAGGKGGRGNMHFATSTNRAPRQAEPGTAGELRKLRLELKLLADVGLVGFPNAGKSTLIARSTKARPKIAAYPFTTLVPHLGVVELKGMRSFVMADIPGLVEGASEGKGLGLRFLKHIERTRLILHLLEVSDDPGREPERDYDVLRRELELHDPALARRPELIVLNKIDRPEVAELLPALRVRFAARGLVLHAISAATGTNVEPLLETVWQALAAAAEQPPSEALPAKSE